MYKPLAAAVIAAVVAALVLALTLVPVAVGVAAAAARRAGTPEDVWLVGALKRVYAPLLDRACMRRAGDDRASRCRWSPRRRCAGAACRLGLHAAARRGRVPDADVPAARGLARRGRSR